MSEEGDWQGANVSVILDDGTEVPLEETVELTRATQLVFQHQAALIENLTRRLGGGEAGNAAAVFISTDAVLRSQLHAIGTPPTRAKKISAGFRAMMADEFYPGQAPSFDAAISRERKKRRLGDDVE